MAKINASSVGSVGSVDVVSTGDNGVTTVEKKKRNRKIDASLVGVRASIHSDASTELDEYVKATGVDKGVVIEMALMALFVKNDGAVDMRKSLYKQVIDKRTSKNLNII